MDTTTDSHRFGELLRTQRVRRGITQRQLADLSTVSVRAIRDLENGRATRPRPDTIRLIADGLGLSGRTLAGFEAAARCAGRPQLAFPGNRADFAPPAALDAIVDRECDAEALCELLTSGSRRLITVCGFAGVGKTRLALEVAASLHHAGAATVLWCAPTDRSPFRRRTDFAGAPMRTSPDRAADGSAPALDELADVITDEPSVLVLDGCHSAGQRMEHVIRLLWRHPALRVLITARTPFDVEGEHAFPLAPLAVPDYHADHAFAERTPAFRLFRRYIRQARPVFEPTTATMDAVISLCHRLDGIPGAMAAVASWLMVYEPDELLASIECDPAAFLADTLPELRESLQQAIAALDTGEVAMLRELAAFQTNWSLRDAIGVTSAPATACARFVRKCRLLGLVRPVDGVGGGRFRVLELVRTHYQLDRGEPWLHAAAG
jgi:transcriptional regulator with XRE-family HTH domain